MDNIVPIHVGLASASGYQMIYNMKVNLSSTVGKLKETIAKMVKCAKEEVNLMYNAEMLPDNAVLQKCNIQRGHILEAVITKLEIAPLPSTTLYEKMCAIVRLLHSLMEKRTFKKILMKLHKNGIVEDIIENTPTLAQDHVAVSLLADLGQVALLHGYPSKILETNVKHPALGSALEKIIDAIRLELESGVAEDLLAEEEELAVNDGAQQPISVDLVTQSIQDAMDRARTPNDEERQSGYMDIIRQVLEGTFQVPPGGANTGPFSGPTQPTQNAGPTLAPVVPESMDVSEPSLPIRQNVSQTSGVPQVDAQVIASIVAQAFASAAGTNTAHEQQPTAMDTEEAGGNHAPAGSDEEMARNLQFMREMGLNDEGANREALRLTNGDLHAAVNLILSRLN